MLVQTRRFLALLTCTILLVALAMAGCCGHCAKNCTPNGLWQSPTMQATRALLVINTEELRILEIDGKKVSPSHVSEDGIREYYLRPGEHSIQATFRYGAPLSAGLLSDVHGEPITLWQEFEAGHEYVAIYREHLYPVSDLHTWTENVITNVLDPQDLYWSLEMADLADDDYEGEPEVVEAKVHCRIVRGPNGPLAQATEF